MSETDRAAPDHRALRRALGAFATGVTVATVIDETGRPRGMTANSFTSVSLDPPLVLVCVAKAAPICATFQAASAFAVNVLSAGQRELSQRFATPMPDRFAGLSWRRGRAGAPILDDSLTFFDCRMDQRIEAGDHIILLGRVEEFGTTDQPPLIFCQGRYLSAANLSVIGQRDLPRRHEQPALARSAAG